MPGSTVTAWCSSASTRRLPATPAIGSRRCRRACRRASKGCPGCARPRSRASALLSRVRQNKRIIGSRPHTSVRRRCRSSTPTGSRRTSSGRWSCRSSSGADFTEQDNGTAPRVAVVNQAFVRSISTVRIPSGSPSSSLATPTASRSSASPRMQSTPSCAAPRLPPSICRRSQQVDGDASFAVRLGGASRTEASFFSAIRSAVREMDPALPVLNLRTQDEQIDRLNGQELLFAKLSGLFGVLALLLACVGLYGLMSHAVFRRTGEIGLRMALGALPGHVLRMILRESLALVGLGILTGIAAAFSAGRIVASMLFGLSPADPLTYGAVAIGLTAHRPAGVGGAGASREPHRSDRRAEDRIGLIIMCQSQIRTSTAHQVARIRRCRAAHPRSRHRRLHGDVQHRRCGAAAAAAVPGSWSPGVDRERRHQRDVGTHDPR